MRPTSIYIVHPVVDALLLGGLSVLCFLGLGSVFGEQNVGQALTVSLVLQWWINWPHFSATCHRLYRKPENLRDYPFTCFLIPILVIGGVVAAILNPTLIAPVWIKLFMVWSPYHFSAQTLGVTLLYARRAGWAINPLQRFGLACFIFGTYFYSTLRAETSLENLSYYGIRYPGLGLPEWSTHLAVGVLWGGLILFAFASKKRLLQMPWILLVPALAQFVWFVLGGTVPTFYYFVPLFHSLQYLLIAWAIHLKETQAERTVHGSWGFVRWESIRWFAMNFVGGAILFWGFPKLVEGFGVSLAFATGVVIAGVQIHHFIVDGVIWKLRNPRVANPLMVTLPDLTEAGDTVRRAA